MFFLPFTSATATAFFANFSFRSVSRVASGDSATPHPLPEERGRTCRLTGDLTPTRSLAQSTDCGSEYAHLRSRFVLLQRLPCPSHSLSLAKKCLLAAIQPLYDKSKSRNLLTCRSCLFCGTMTNLPAKIPQWTRKLPNRKL